MLNRFKVFSPFYLLTVFYFIIPFIIKPIDPPSFLVYLDQYIPFIWWLIIPYYFHYIAFLLPPLLIKDINSLKLLTKTLNISTLCCYFMYILWPVDCALLFSNIPPNPLSFMHNIVLFEYLHQNAFPSMHVVVSSLIGLVFLREIPKYRILSYILIVGVFFSTFVIKQHFILDSISGLILALLMYKFYYLNYSRIV